jgi:hypothetical protein
METTASELVHHVVTVTDGFEHRAECCCGWESEWYLDDVEAVEAGVEHPEIAVGPPDGLDVFVSGLLDVQDDLAALVVWLAENWDAGLPVPVLRGSTGAGPGRLEVGLYCESDEELARVAERIGAPVTHEPRYDDEDATYEHAHRDFGRVGFEAWRYRR